jgi:hypothetical protein
MERVNLYGLAAAGALQGFARYYVRPEMTARRMWMAIGLGVTAYEIACPENELLSEGVDRALESHRLLTTAAIGVTALHLVNVLPERFDPFTQGLKFLKGHGR